MNFLDWKKKRALAFITIALAGLAHVNVFGISNILSPLTEFPVLGEIKVITILGIVTVVLAAMLYNRKLG